jgi:hypothetical protein
VTEKSTGAEREIASRLLAGGAHIHVDFHAAGHFNDLRGFPGHFGSPSCEFGRIRPVAKLVRAEKFASEIFPDIGSRPAELLHCKGRLSRSGKM